MAGTAQEERRSLLPQTCQDDGGQEQTHFEVETIISPGQGLHPRSERENTKEMEQNWSGSGAAPTQ